MFKRYPKTGVLFDGLHVRISTVSLSRRRHYYIAERKKMLSTVVKGPFESAELANQAGLEQINSMSQ